MTDLHDISKNIQAVLVFMCADDLLQNNMWHASTCSKVSFSCFIYHLQNSMRLHLQNSMRRFSSVPAESSASLVWLKLLFPSHLSPTPFTSALMGSITSFLKTSYVTEVTTGPASQDQHNNVGPKWFFLLENYGLDATPPTNVNKIKHIKFGTIFRQTVHSLASLLNFKICRYVCPTFPVVKKVRKSPSPQCLRETCCCQSTENA